VIGKGSEPRLAVLVIAHEDRKLAARCECTGTVGDQQRVAFEERGERRRPRQVAAVLAIEFLPPVRRV
jgi:hypothetical protein